jgi:photosynthetic reaction center cytochrome c subunit
MTNPREHRQLMARLANRNPAADFVFILCLFLVCLLGIGGATGEVPANSAPKKTSSEKKSGEVFKNLKVLNETPSDLLLPSMQFMSSSLGVHCEFCHVENAFEKDDKKPKQTARQMMRMVERINTTAFHGKQQITCNSCHRGSPTPLSTPVISETPAQLLSAPAPDMSQSPGQPSPADIIGKYIQARGGTESLANLNSLQERGTFRSGPAAFPLELYAANPVRSGTVIHFPGADRIAAFDGASGWISLPGSPTREMTAAEADAARIDAELQLGLDPNKIFPEIKLAKISKVGAEDAVVLSCRRPGLPPVEMYFAASSGLLLRAVHYSPSPLGLNPTQTDYSDYREISGVKVPFHWTSSTPEGSFTVQIESAQANQPLPENIFTAPTGR